MHEAAVIVVNWNLSKLTRRSVRSLNSEPGTAIREIVVVDNGSTDGSADDLEAAFGDDPRVRVVRLPENVGFGGGANAGIRATDAPFVVLLNNDAEAAPGFVDALVRTATAPGADRVGAVTARILLEGRWSPADADGRIDPAALTASDGSRWVRDDSGIELVNSTGNVVDRTGNGADRDWLASATSRAEPDVFGFCGGGALLRREALTETGLFDASLFMYYEDTDLSYRLRAHGWTVRYAADAVVHHRHAASSGTESSSFARWNARNRLLVALRHAPRAVVVRAVARSLGRAVATAARRDGANARPLLAALLDVAKRAPRELRARRLRARGTIHPADRV